MIKKFNNLNKIYRIIIIIILIIIGFLSINTFINNKEKQLRNYFTDNEYYNEHESSTYSKLVSDLDLTAYNIKIKNNTEAKYEINYFNIKTSEFKKNKRMYQKNIESNLNEIYSYKTNNIIYNYRVVIDNMATAIYKGNYNIITEEFTCKREYIYNLDAEDDDELICDNIKDELSTFEIEAYTIIDDNIIKLMQK